jgi:hypothetical protein
MCLLCVQRGLSAISAETGTSRSMLRNVIIYFSKHCMYIHADGLLRCDAVLTVVPTFRKTILPPSSEVNKIVMTSSGLNMDTLCFSKSIVSVYKSTRRYNSKGASWNPWEPQSHTRASMFQKRFRFYQIVHANMFTCNRTSVLHSYL